MSEQQDIERILLMVDDMVERDRDAIRGQQEGPPPGGGPVDDDTFRSVFEQHLAQSPPVAMIDPSGALVERSPWLLMLAHVEGGPEWLRRYERIVMTEPVVSEVI